MTDPDVEIGVDPRRGENSRCDGNFTSGGDGFAGGEGPEILVALDAPIKLAEKGAAVARIVFPGVFAVEKKTNRKRLIAQHGFSQLAHAIVEIRRSGFGVHAAINEADEIGKMVVTEQTGNSVRGELHLPGSVEPIGVGGNAIAVAEESDVERAAKDSFIGSKPAKALFGGDGERLIGNRTFGRPQAGGLRAKNSLVILARKTQLFARIFVTAVGAAREGRAGIGDARDIGIAD